MTHLTLSDLFEDLVYFSCAKENCPQFSVPLRVLVQQFGLNAKLADIARGMSCRAGCHVMVRLG